MDGRGPRWASCSPLGAWVAVSRGCSLGGSTNLAQASAFLYRGTTLEGTRGAGYLPLLRWSREKHRRLRLENETSSP